MQPVGNRGRSMNRLARQLPAAAREHTISQCQTNASRMMIGMGIPSSQSKIPRPIAVLLREMREGQFAPTQLKGPGVADRALPPRSGIRFRIDQALAALQRVMVERRCVGDGILSVSALLGAQCPEALDELRKRWRSASRENLGANPYLPQIMASSLA